MLREPVPAGFTGPRQLVRRGGRTANAPVLKTGVRKDMRVRIPPPPLPLHSCLAAGAAQRRIPPPPLPLHSCLAAGAASTANPAFHRQGETVGPSRSPPSVFGDLPFPSLIPSLLLKQQVKLLSLLARSPGKLALTDNMITRGMEATGL